MRIPEQCPFCGADLENDSYGALERYQCGTMLNPAYGVIMLSCDAVFSDTPDAKAYRQRLLWRKRLSQHTGVPLRRCPEADVLGLVWAEWVPLAIVMCKRSHVPGRTRMVGMQGRIPRDEARRRLLAMEVKSD